MGSPFLLDAKVRWGLFKITQNIRAKLEAVSEKDIQGVRKTFRAVSPHPALQQPEARPHGVNEIHMLPAASVLEALPVVLAPWRAESRSFC